MNGLNIAGAGTISGIGTIATLSPQLRESEIDMEINALDREISATFESVQQLVERLRPVCSPNVPPTGNGETKPENVMSPMADTLRRQRTSLRQTRDNLDWVLSSLSL